MQITYAPLPTYPGQPNISITIGSSASPWPNSLIGRKQKNGSWDVDVVVDGKTVNRIHIPSDCAPTTEGE